MDQEIRPELAAFAKVMESRLKENAHRGTGGPLISTTLPPVWPPTSVT